jgi:hypothetical protein
MVKICGKCKQKKEPSYFYKDSKKSDGLRTICKLCEDKRRNPNKVYISESDRNRRGRPSKPLPRDYFIENKKICIKCHQLKNLDDFFKNKKTKDGYLYVCKKCHIDQKREIIHNNFEYYHKKRVERYLKNKEKDILRSMEWNKNNLEKYKENKKRYTYNHPEKFKSPPYRLRQATRSRLTRLLKGRGSKYNWKALIGYDFLQLKIHLEKQFTKEMNWGNYGSYWEVDHIIPVSYFNAISVDSEDFKRCWCLDNLQPLTVRENRIKKNKIVIPNGIQEVHCGS